MTFKPLSILARSSCRTSWICYLGQPDEDFLSLIKQPKFCLNALDIARLSWFLPLGALLGWLAGFVPVFSFIYLSLLALCLNGLGRLWYEVKSAALANRRIVFSKIWQDDIGAPCNFISTDNIQTAISSSNGQGFLVITHLREVYYLPRHCLLGESNTRLLEACTRHFT